MIDTPLREELPSLPPRMRHLPVDSRGYPVPWFVGWVDGVPDFRVLGPGKREQAVKETRCWICGRQRGKYGAFVIGPMCAINRISSEPPSHRECAEFAIQSCPFMMRPQAKRREAGLPEEATEPDGIMITRNPGVYLLWVSQDWQPVSDNKGGWLIHVGTPTSVSWWREGRSATRAEVQESFDSGCPILGNAATEDGEDAVANYERELARALKLLPEGPVS